MSIVRTLEAVADVADNVVTEEAAGGEGVEVRLRVVNRRGGRMLLVAGTGAHTPPLRPDIRHPW